MQAEQHYDNQRLSEVWHSDKEAGYAWEIEC